ncbi:MAG: hypothetical protein VX346_22190 [Planctomycetota bacterium]|nr:hypothetical protein [Planctomycetota bacterium]
MFVSSLPVVLVFLMAPVALHATLFLLARRPVRLVLTRLGKYQIGLAAVVAAPLLTGWAPDLTPAVSHSIQISLVACVATGMLLQTFGGACLLRINRSDYLDMLGSGCKRLLLSFELKEGETKVVLLGKGRTETLPLRQLSRRVVWTRFPARTPHDKITLLGQYLQKSLPGPLPRFRIVMKKRAN